MSKNPSSPELRFSAVPELLQQRDACRASLVNLTRAVISDNLGSQALEHGDFPETPAAASVQNPHVVDLQAVKDSRMQHEQRLKQEVDELLGIVAQQAERFTDERAA